MSKYTYYVVYIYKTNILELGYGSCFTVRNKPIKDNNDLLEIQEQIKKDNNFEQVIIINFKRMKFKKRRRK